MSSLVPQASYTPMKSHYSLERGGYIQWPGGLETCVVSIFNAKNCSSRMLSVI